MDREKITYAAIASLGTLIAFTSSKENAAKYAACVLMSRFIDLNLLKKLGLDEGTYFSKGLVRLLSMLQFFAADAFVGSSISKLIPADHFLLESATRGSAVGIALFSTTLDCIESTENFKNRSWIRVTGYNVAAHFVSALSFSYFRSDSFVSKLSAFSHFRGDSLLSNFLAFSSMSVLSSMMYYSPLCTGGLNSSNNKRLANMAEQLKPSKWLAGSVVSATALTFASYLTSKSPKLEAAGIIVPAACLTVLRLLCEKPKNFLNQKLSEHGL